MKRLLIMLLLSACSDDAAPPLRYVPPARNQPTVPMLPLDVTCKFPRALGLPRFKNLERIGGSGTFALEPVTQEIKNRMGDLKGCYDEQLEGRRPPLLEGTVIAEFTLESSGAVSRVHAGMSTDQAELETCVREYMKRFRFNAGPQGGNASYRFSITFTAEIRCWQGGPEGPE